MEPFSWEPVADSFPLASAFLTAASRDRSVDLAALEETLARLLAKARAEWPDVQLEPTVFVRHLARHIANVDDPSSALAPVRAGDLYLACACAHGVRAAIAAFEASYISKLPGYLRRFRKGGTFVEDVCQTVRERLLVARDGGTPRIAEYSGRGFLLNWVRVAGLRAALNLSKGAEPSGSEPEEGLADEALFPAPDPELAYIKATYRDSFRAAVASALASLTQDEASVLRFYVLDRLNIAEIGAIYGVHRATIARWIAESREKVLKETRRHLRERLDLSPSEFESLVALLRSELLVSLQGALGKRAEDEPG
jgi:RNA polymerase sigma-70 factor (ECF subfamily)